MKVLDIYSKNSDKRIFFGNVCVFEIMDNFFKKMPKSYGRNYYNNLKSLKIIHVDEMYNSNDQGRYIEQANTIIIKELFVLIHELMHMASFDMVNYRTAFLDDMIELFGGGLLEGMTEYLAMKALGEDEPTTYQFPVFCVEMLSNIEGLFKPYFVPSYQNFIKLFPDNIDILSLMYSLNYYNENWLEDEVNEENMKNSIKNTIDSLINIEIKRNVNKLFMVKGLVSIDSFGKLDSKKLRLYRDKFMDLISSEELEASLGCFYKDYKNYANSQLNKRLFMKR